jgi:hypothetical protein
VVNTLKVFLDVTFENKPVVPDECAITLYCRVGAFSLSAGVGIVDKGLIEKRLYDIAQGMVNHSVSVWCGAYQALFWIVDNKVAV